mmetsp:Transcript_3764/g.4180  ORF Transcript_3764/g.4180 Transcript_3764/m.4180 type:complete len:736 (+) Transcript_3764:125-2332(+)
MSPLDPIFSPEVPEESPNVTKVKEADDATTKTFLLPPCKMPSRDDLKPIVDFIASSIKDPSSHGYKSMLECLKSREDSSTLYRLFIVLRIHGPTLHELTTYPQKHGKLLHYIFRIDPLSVPFRLRGNVAYVSLVDSYDFARAYFHLLLVIVSANSTFLNATLRAFWNLLVHHVSVQNEGEEPVKDVDREQRLNYIHAALAKTLRLVPRAAVELQSVIAVKFPFRSSPFIVKYVEQALIAVQSYGLMSEANVLELIVDKAMEMDVEIKIKDDGDVEIDNEKLTKNKDDDDEAIFEMDIDKATEKPPPTPEELSKEATVKKIDEMAERLDSIMLLLFQHVEKRLQGDPTSALTLFQLIIPIFENNILTTYRSKYVQFIVFHLCGATKCDDIYREFAGYLIEGILDPYRSTAIRQISTCYLASFVSRANYVCPETACETVSALLRWAETYLAVMEQEENDLINFQFCCEKHSLFYTVCQAAFYLMCFRGVEVIDHHRSALAYFANNPSPVDDSIFADLDLIDLSQARWEKICGHYLNPLRFCLESVREEFIDLAKAHSLLTIELQKKLNASAKKQSSSHAKPNKRRGKRINTPAISTALKGNYGVGGMGKGSNPLDSFFPFDPYLLRESHELIGPLYRDWNGGIEVEDDNDVEVSSLPEDYGYEDDDDDSIEEDESSVVMQATSYQSVQSTMMSESSPTAISDISSPRILEHRHSQNEAWDDSLKRPRAQSITQCGSW